MTNQKLPGCDETFRNRYVYTLFIHCMKTLTLRKWGNSLAIRLPRTITEDHGLHDGSKIRYSESRTKLVLNLDEEALTLKDLVDRITPENLHPATDWGDPIGKEIW